MRSLGSHVLGTKIPQAVTKRRLTPKFFQVLIAQHRHSTVLWEGLSHDDVWDLSVPSGRICANVAAGPSHGNLKS